FEVEPERVELEQVGLNHLTWIRAVRVDGVDRMAELLDDELADDVHVAIERELLELYRDPKLDVKPELLEHRGGAFYSEAAAQLIASLQDGRGDLQVVDVRNDGTLPGLADDD